MDLRTCNPPRNVKYLNDSDECNSLLNIIDLLMGEHLICYVTNRKVSLIFTNIRFIALKGKFYDKEIYHKSITNINQKNNCFSNRLIIYSIVDGRKRVNYIDLSKNTCFFVHNLLNKLV